MKNLMMRRLSPLWGALALVLVQNLQLVTQNIPTAIANEVPKGECIESFGRGVVCGYNCITTFLGHMGCADWPGGVCVESSFRIICGPPAPPNWGLLYTQDECNQIQHVRQLAKKQGLDDASLARLESRYCHSSKSRPSRGR